MATRTGPACARSQPAANRRAEKNPAPRLHPGPTFAGSAAGGMVFALAGQLGRGVATAGPVASSPAPLRAGAATEFQKPFGPDQSGLQHQLPGRPQIGTGWDGI